jgi:hypothetical protein
MILISNSQAVYYLPTLVPSDVPNSQIDVPNNDLTVLKIALPIAASLLIMAMLAGYFFTRMKRKKATERSEAGDCADSWADGDRTIPTAGINYSRPLPQSYEPPLVQIPIQPYQNKRASLGHVPTSFENGETIGDQDSYRATDYSSYLSSPTAMSPFILDLSSYFGFPTTKAALSKKPISMHNASEYELSPREISGLDHIKLSAQINNELQTNRMSALSDVYFDATYLYSPPDSLAVGSIYGTPLADDFPIKRVVSQRSAGLNSLNTLVRDGVSYSSNAPTLHDISPT